MVMSNLGEWADMLPPDVNTVTALYLSILLHSVAEIRA